MLHPWQYFGDQSEQIFVTHLFTSRGPLKGHDQLKSTSKEQSFVSLIDHSLFVIDVFSVIRASLFNLGNLLLCCFQVFKSGML